MAGLFVYLHHHQQIQHQTNYTLNIIIQMNKNQSNLVPIHTQTSQKAFFTDVPHNPQEIAGKKVLNYVENLQSKLAYAKWKQQLVLTYNYMPLKRITEKIQTEKINYLKKIQDQQQKCLQILSGKQITVQLDLFRDFSKRLDSKMKEIEAKIEAENIKREVLEAEAAQKRNALKSIMKENMNLIKQQMEINGIKTKEDIVVLVRSKSTKDRFLKSLSARNHLTERKGSVKQLKKGYQSSRENIFQRGQLKSSLFLECLEKVTSSIQGMNTIEDIQSGIFLDVMHRPIKKYSHEGRFSLKSKISDTLHSRFGSMHHQNTIQDQGKSDFEMDWETFKNLNWKQIMGIVLVKDKNCKKIKQLLQFN